MRGARHGELRDRDHSEGRERDVPPHHLVITRGFRREKRRKPLNRAASGTCAGEDLNLHDPTGHKALNLARLPIPPPAQETGVYLPTIGSESAVVEQIPEEHGVDHKRDCHSDRQPGQVSLHHRGRAELLPMNVGYEFLGHGGERVFALARYFAGRVFPPFDQF